LGNRLRLRREQLGILAPRAAAHLGVSSQIYQEYESGERPVPAKELAGIAEFFTVPVYYFFEDLQIGEVASDVPELSPPRVYTIATEADRIAALIDDFQRLGFERQQLVLLIIKALANSAEPK
jgi:transcriptional regulator with XRE-family HTH domain